MLRLTNGTLEEIQDHGVVSYPYEGCGLLLGRIVNGDNIVEAIYTVPNRWEDEEEKRVRFLIHDQDMLRAEMAAAEKGLDVIGIFHSHPDHPPEASPRDLAWAAWTGYSYLITEIRDGQPLKSRSWQLLLDRSGFKEEAVVIDENGGQ